MKMLYRCACILFMVLTFCSAQDVILHLCKLNSGLVETRGMLQTNLSPPYVDNHLCYCEFSTKGPGYLDLALQFTTEEQQDQRCKPVLNLGGPALSSTIRTCPESGEKVMRVEMENEKPLYLGVDNDKNVNFNAKIQMTATLPVSVSCYEMHQGALMGNTDWLYPTSDIKQVTPDEQLAIAFCVIAFLTVMVILFLSLVRCIKGNRRLKEEIKSALQKTPSAKSRPLMGPVDNPAYEKTPAPSLYSGAPTPATGSLYSVSLQPGGSTTSLSAISTLSSVPGGGDPGLNIIMTAGVRPKTRPAPSNTATNGINQHNSASMINNNDDVYKQGPKENRIGYHYHPTHSGFDNLSPNLGPHQLIEKPLIHRSPSPFREDIETTGFPAEFDPRSPVTVDAPQNLWTKPGQETLNQRQPQQKGMVLYTPENVTQPNLVYTSHPKTDTHSQIPKISRPYSEKLPSHEPFHSSYPITKSQALTGANKNVSSYPIRSNKVVNIAHMPPQYRIADDNFDITDSDLEDGSIGPLPSTPSKNSGIYPPSPMRTISRSSGDYGPDKYSIQIVRPTGETEV